VRGAKVPVQSTLGIASPEVRTIAVAGNAGDRHVIEATFDGGATWARVLDLAALMPVDLGFTTPSQGVVIGVDPSGAASANAFYMTRDGGHAWSQVRFAP
jgi:photosystem II stability/assembly factor-like uncharacterized protein